VLGTPLPCSSVAVLFRTPTPPGSCLRRARRRHPDRRPPAPAGGGGRRPAHNVGGWGAIISTDGSVGLLSSALVSRAPCFLFSFLSSFSLASLFCFSTSLRAIRQKDRAWAAAAKAADFALHAARRVRAGRGLDPLALALLTEAGQAIGLWSAAARLRAPPSVAWSRMAKPDRPLVGPPPLSPPARRARRDALDAPSCFPLPHSYLSR